MAGSLAKTNRTLRTNVVRNAGLQVGKAKGHDYRSCEQESIAAECDLASHRGRIQETRSALSGSREQLSVLTAKTKRKALDGLRQAREQMEQFAQGVTKTGQREQVMLLHAPVSGTVQQLAIHTAVGAVTPVRASLAVVPSEEEPEVEATVLNKDIGFVRPGQRVTVKVESFPYIRYGYLDGTVESVSHDAAQDEKMGLVFRARVKLAAGR